MTRSEVDAVGRGEAVEETMPLPDGSSFSYVLAVAGMSVAARQSRDGDDTRIVVEIPSADASAWASSLEVGLAGETPVEVGPLQILIEKDFTCINPRAGEEELDTFPNPNNVAAS